MHIKTIKSQNRRDFQAVYACEHCDAEHEGSGYDDSYFHQNVVPAMKCKECGKTADGDIAPRSPKHPDGAQL